MRHQHRSGQSHQGELEARRREVERKVPFHRQQMAGKYVGYHRFSIGNGSFQGFWRTDGWWWWWPRKVGTQPTGEAIGPFLTSTEAYRHANSPAGGTADPAEG